MPTFIFSVVHRSIGSVDRLATAKRLAIFCLLGLVSTSGVAQQNDNPALPPPSTAPSENSQPKLQTPAWSSMEKDLPATNRVTTPSEFDTPDDDEITKPSSLPATFSAQLAKLRDEAADNFPDAPEPPPSMLNSESPSVPRMDNALRAEQSPPTRPPSTQPSPLTSSSDRPEAESTFTKAPSPTPQDPRRQTLTPPVTNRLQPPPSGIMSSTPLPSTSSNSSGPLGNSDSNWSATPPTDERFQNQAFAAQASDAGQTARGVGHQPIPTNTTVPAATPNSATNDRFGGSILADQRRDKQTTSGRPPAFHRDNAVQRTGFEQPIPSPNTNIAAKSLMGRYSLDRTVGVPPGEAMRLVDMFRQPIATQQRNSMVQFYWKTFYDWALLVSAQEQQRWLNQVSQATTASDRAILDAAKFAAGNRVLALEIQLTKTQSQLLRFIPNRTSGRLPLPSDQPFVQVYDTHYDQYLSRNLIPTHLVGIDQVLQKSFVLIGNRANAVELAQKAAAQTRADWSAGRSTLVTLLESVRLWRTAERDLIATVTRYNQSIADFSLTVSRQYKTPEQLTAMLIGESIAQQAPSVALGGDLPSVMPADNTPSIANPTSNQRFGSQSSPLPSPPAIQQSSVAPATRVGTGVAIPVSNQVSPPAGNSQFGSGSQSTSPFGNGLPTNTTESFPSQSPANGPPGSSPTLLPSSPKQYPDRSANSGF